MSRTEIEPHVLLSYKTKWFNSFWKYNETLSKTNNSTGFSNSTFSKRNLNFSSKNNSKINLIDRKNFSVSISKDKNKIDEKQGGMNKNYTFQNNAEAKKIISNINNEGSIDNSKIRASLGIKAINSKELNRNSISNLWDFKKHSVKSHKQKILHQKPNYEKNDNTKIPEVIICLLYTAPSPRDLSTSRMPSSA